MGGANYRAAPSDKIGKQLIQISHPLGTASSMCGARPGRIHQKRDLRDLYPL